MAGESFVDGLPCLNYSSGVDDEAASGDLGDEIVAAVMQLNCQDDVSENLRMTERALQEAANRGAQLVLLPENFAYFGADSQRHSHAEAMGDRAAPIQAALSEWATRFQLWIIAGGMPERNDDGLPPFNTSVVFAPDGSLRGRYRKIHLFDVSLPDVQLAESASTSAGSEVVVVDAGKAQIGLSVCYDLRFPALYQAQTACGANLLTVPAAFTRPTGEAHWEVLLRARAVECQSYVLAAGQCGEHPNSRSTYGHSMLIDPWGRVLATCGSEPGVALATLSLAELEGIRSRMPIQSHRRDLPIE